jgi:mRNA-degrading endonuclease HigB of HigAB toxin-antitoxin module
MRIIAISQLKTFWQKYPDSEQSLLAWIDEAKKANWQTPQTSRANFAMRAFSKAAGSCSTSKAMTTG